MLRKSVSLTAPLGIVLVLAFSGTFNYTVMKDLAATFDVETQTQLSVPPRFLFGELGVLLFGLGLLISATLRQKHSTASAGLLAFAAMCFLIGGGSIAYGTWILIAAFRALASVAVIDAQVFEVSVEASRLPLLCGWISIFAGAFVLSLARVSGAQRPGVKFGLAYWLGLVGGLFLLLSIAYGLSGHGDLKSALESPPPFDAADLASALTSLLLARLVTAFGIFFAAIATAVMALNMDAASEHSELAQESHELPPTRP